MNSLVGSGIVYPQISKYTLLQRSNKAKEERLTVPPKGIFGTLPSNPSGFATRNLKSTFAKIILISFAAKKRPGHACLPYPNGK